MGAASVTSAVAVVALLCLGHAASAAAGDAPAAPPKPVARNSKVPKNVTGIADKPQTMLSSNTTGVGGSCVPTSQEFFGPGSGCSDSEACCPTTNTCLDRSGGCAAFAKRCPPPDCGKDLTFANTECPAEVTKLYKKASAVKCQASADTFCFTNSTSLALRCADGRGRSSGAAPAAGAAATLLAGALALALPGLL